VADVFLPECTSIVRSRRPNDCAKHGTPRTSIGFGRDASPSDAARREPQEGLFEEIFKRYDKASVIGFATVPSEAPQGLELATVHRMILGAVNGLKARVLVEFDGVSLVQRARQVMFRIARPSLAV
jgi:hypothetical protein